MKKLYFPKDNPEYCNTLDYFRDEMKENGINRMELVRAKMVTGESYFFCSFHGEVGEVGEGCGKQCSKYKPRNGKNGRCIHSKNTYEPTDEIKILTPPRNK